MNIKICGSMETKETKHILKNNNNNKLLNSTNSLHGPNCMETLSMITNIDEPNSYINSVHNIM